MLYQDDPSLDVLILKQGIIKIYDVDSHGNEKILHLLRPYGIAPLAFFSGGNVPMQWFYAALTDCDVCVLTSDELSAQILSDSEMSVQLMNWFSLEVHELLVRLSSFGKTNAREKVRAALKFLAKHYADQRRSGWKRVMFPVNQQMLADMTGLTRESIATIMRDLQASESVRRPRQTILELNPAVFH